MTPKTQPPVPPSTPARQTSFAPRVRTFELPRIPGVLGIFAAALPQRPPAAMLSCALNLFARDIFPADEAQRLDGKVIVLHVRDAGLRVALRVTRGAYKACAAGVAADATVAADARDFLRLAVGSVDPDTLFFDRRLLIEGDTEVGLIVKNALDRIPLPLPPQLVQLLRGRLA